MDDSFAYSSKFRLRVLVQPVYPLRKTEYDKHLKLLRRHSRIALADVPAAPAPVSTSQANVVEDKRSILPALTPSPASRGTLQLDFIETWDRDLRWLEEFEAHRRVCAVIGIVDCAEWGQKLDDAVASFAELTLENAPQDAFAYRCYGFNPSDAVADNADGLVVVPNVGDLGFYMHTLLAEVCSAILAGLSDIVSVDAGRQQMLLTGRYCSIEALKTPVYRPRTHTWQRHSRKVQQVMDISRLRASQHHLSDLL